MLSIVHLGHALPQNLKEISMKIKPQEWTKPVLCYKKLGKNFKKRAGWTMFPTTHDITSNNIDHSVMQLESLLKAGNKVLIVTKPNYDCMTKLCDALHNYKDNIIVRMSIGSLDSKVLKFWGTQCH
jgi:hypothetical protein